MLELSVDPNRSSLYTENCKDGSGKRRKLDSGLSSHMNTGSNSISEYLQCVVDNDSDKEEDNEGDEEREQYSSKAQIGRRTHHSDIEALNVAKAWVNQSEHSANQKGAPFREGVCNRLE